MPAAARARRPNWSSCRTCAQWRGDRSKAHWQTQGKDSRSVLLIAGGRRSAFDDRPVRRPVSSTRRQLQVSILIADLVKLVRVVVRVGDRVALNRRRLQQAARHDAFVGIHRSQSPTGLRAVGADQCMDLATLRLAACGKARRAKTRARTAAVIRTSQGPECWRDGVRAVRRWEAAGRYFFSGGFGGS